MVGKRPPSLSESNIYFGVHKFKNVEEFTLSVNGFDKTLEFIENIPLEDKSNISTLNKWILFEYILDYAMRFNFHILLISIFEIIFYFSFVSKDEDNGILQTTNYYTNAIFNSCKNLTENEIIYLNLMLNNLLNSSLVLSEGANSVKTRNIHNTLIYNLSLQYVGIIMAIQIGLFIVNYMNKFQFQWRHLFFENIALVGLLGLYELMFFETIIKQYHAESPQEISALFVNGLQSQCKLLL